MPYINVYIDEDVVIPKISTGLLKDELLRRKGKKGQPKIDVVDYDNHPLINLLIQIPTRTLNDQLKIEHLIRVWDRYDLTQIETLLPEQK